jgi:hypothetical protein
VHSFLNQMDASGDEVRSEEDNIIYCHTLGKR